MHNEKIEVITIKDQTDRLFSLLNPNREAAPKVLPILNSLVEWAVLLIARATKVLAENMEAVTKGEAYAITDALEAVYALALMAEPSKGSVGYKTSCYVLNLINSILKLRDAQNADEMVEVYREAYQNHNILNSVDNGELSMDGSSVLTVIRCYRAIVSPLFYSELGEAYDAFRSKVSEWQEWIDKLKEFRDNYL